MDRFKKLNAEIQKIDSGEWFEVDFGFITESLLEMSSSDKAAVRSQMKRLILHLLKTDYQKQRETRSWSVSIVDARQTLGDIFEDSKSLRVFAESILDQSYSRAAVMFEVETGLSKRLLPKRCPYSFEQMMNVNFYGNKR